MIAFHILCHDGFEQVTRLVESLHRPDNVFLVDIDDGKRPDTRALSRLASFGNVRIKRDSRIGWGGQGTLRKTIEGAFELLDMNDAWQYYVVVSGQDLPLKPRDEIHERLRAAASSGTNFIRSTLAAPVPLERLVIDNHTSENRLWADRGHTRVWGLPGTVKPNAQFHARRHVVVHEMPSGSDVFVAPCDAMLTRRRDDFFARTPLHVGANWFNLHRSLLEHMRADPFTYELYEVMRTTYIPDESFFQTYVSNSPFANTVSAEYGRLIPRLEGIADVRLFGDEDWPLIRDSDALFGRKFDLRKQPGIVNRLLESIAA